MAESRRAKAKRWLNRDFTKAELQGIVGILVADQVIDVATGGRLSAMKKTALKKIVLPLAARGTAVAGTTAGRLAMTGLRAGKMVAVSHPILTAGTIAYIAYQNREELGALVEQGYDILSPVGEALQERLPPMPIPAPMIPSMPVLPDISATIGRIKTQLRRPSKFNLAVKEGMATVKKSKSFGAKGKFNNSKKAFAMVTKVVSRTKRGIIPKRGIAKKIYLAIRRFFK